MVRRLPPLNTLRAFEAVARHLSITGAAEELGVTPGAVSQSVKALEEYLGRPLMSRTPRGLVLTEESEAALPALREGFDRLEEGARRLTGPDRGGRLTVSVAPSFGAKWLAPRLPEFNIAFPDLDVQIHASMGLTNFESEGVDLAVRYGAGKWPGCEARLLMREEVTPVCSHRLAGELERPGDLTKFTLIHDDSSRGDESCPDWSMWLKAAGVQDVDAARGPRFNQSSLALEAAAAGRGVVLAKRALAQADLDSGRLIAPFAMITPIDFAYYVVHPPGRARSRAARRFIEWLTEQGQAYAHAVRANASLTDSSL